MSAYQGSNEIEKSCSSGKDSLIGKEEGAFGRRDKWSAITLSDPFLSLIVRSNSWSKRIQRIKRDLASFLTKRYLSAEWSVKTVMCEPIK